MKTTLIIDFSNPKANIGLAVKNRFDSITIEEDKKHSELFLTILDILLKRNNIEIKNIERIFLSKDPGSYTSLRVAYASAKAFAIALNIEIFTFERVKDLELLSPDYN